MTSNDLLACLLEARAELATLASYVDEPGVAWPNVGLKLTAKAHKRMVERIDTLLATSPPEDISAREENLALRAALRSRASDELWRLRFLEEQERAADLSVELDGVREVMRRIVNESEAILATANNEINRLKDGR